MQGAQHHRPEGCAYSPPSSINFQYMAGDQQWSNACEDPQRPLLLHSYLNQRLTCALTCRRPGNADRQDQTWKNCVGPQWLESYPRASFGIGKTVHRFRSSKLSKSQRRGRAGVHARRLETVCQSGRTERAFLHDRVVFLEHRRPVGADPAAITTPDAFVFLDEQCPRNRIALERQCRTLILAWSIFAMVACQRKEESGIGRSFQGLGAVDLAPAVSPSQVVCHGTGQLAGGATGALVQGEQEAQVAHRPFSSASTCTRVS